MLVFVQGRCLSCATAGGKSTGWCTSTASASSPVIEQLCAASGLRTLSLENQPHVLHYPDVRSLTHELKALGAHNLNPGRPGGLTGRARILGLVEAYEQFREASGLPATYQVVYAVLEKPV